MTEMDKKQKQKQASDDAEGYAVYQKIASLMGWGDNVLFYFGGIKKVEVIHDEENNKLELATFPFSEKDAKNVIDKDDVKKLFSYIMRRKEFSKTPFLSSQGFLTHGVKGSEKGYVFREELKDKTMEEMQEWMSHSHTKIDYNTGRITTNIPMAKIIDSNNKQINKLFKIIFPCPKERKVAKQYAALYAFENRYGLAKPTLVMYGKLRGTGKNVFVEHLLGSIYPEQIQPAPGNIEQFTASLSNKGLLYDEKAEHGTGKKSYKFYDELKKQSGSMNTNINIKGKESYNVKSGCFIMITSQLKPFDLKDEIQSSANNQFLVFKMANTDTEQIPKLDLEVTKIKGKEYHDLSEFLKKNIGHYIWTELFDVYEKMKLEAKNKSYRYGMDVPITIGLIDIKAKSLSPMDKSCIDIYEDLYNGDSTNYPLNGKSLTLFNYFSKKSLGKKRGFLVNSVRKKILKEGGVSPGADSYFLDRYSLIEKETRLYIDVSKEGEYEDMKNRTGIKIDFERLGDIIKNDLWTPKIIDATNLSQTDEEVDVS